MRSKRSFDCHSIAIVDETPETQYLLPEFELFQNLFAQHGIDAVIAGPEDFCLANGRLSTGGKDVDLVYNRLTDFYLQSEICGTLKAAVPHSERVVSADGEALTMKVDVRCYTYRGAMQLLGARMYRGQTTNFRTASGGLAAVFTTPAT